MAYDNKSFPPYCMFIRDPSPVALLHAVITLGFRMVRQPLLGRFSWQREERHTTGTSSLLSITCVLISLASASHVAMPGQSTSLSMCSELENLSTLWRPPYHGPVAPSAALCRLVLGCQYRDFIAPSEAQRVLR